jgi:hypothetical protein
MLTLKQETNHLQMKFDNQEETITLLQDKVSDFGKLFV